MLERWSLVEGDFQLHHHIDLADPKVLDGRQWRWFVVRLMALPQESRTWRALRDLHQPTMDEALDDVDADLGVHRPT